MADTAYERLTSWLKYNCSKFGMEVEDPNLLSYEAVQQKTKDITAEMLAVLTNFETARSTRLRYMPADEELTAQNHVIQGLAEQLTKDNILHTNQFVDTFTQSGSETVRLQSAASWWDDLSAVMTKKGRLHIRATDVGRNKELQARVQKTCAELGRITLLYIGATLPDTGNDDLYEEERQQLTKLCLGFDATGNSLFKLGACGLYDPAYMLETAEDAEDLLKVVKTFCSLSQKLQTLENALLLAGHALGEYCQTLYE